jgi:20S proteasome subunit beta 7
MSRLRPISTNTLLGASGDISDFQSVLDDLERARVEDVCAEDGAFLSTSEISSWLSRVTYQRRNKMNFLWNTFVVAGVTEKKEAYLSVVDKLGTSYQEKFAATGFGAHLALPLLRERWNPNLTKDEAKKLLEDCMRVLYYRDCRTINRIQFGTFCVCSSKYCSRENSQ